MSLPLMDMSWVYLVYGVVVAGAVHALRRHGTPAPMASFPTVFLVWRQWLIVGGVALFTLVVSEPPRLLEDFREAYYPAGVAVVHGPEQLMAQLERGVEGFVNLPVVAYAFAPLGLLDSLYAELLFCVLGLAAILVGWWCVGRAAKLDATDSWLLLLLFAASGPLHNSLKEGNTSHIVLALLAAALLALQRKREFLAGAALGVAGLLKLPLLVFGLYYALRGAWRVVLGGVLVCGGAVAISLLVFGWDAHRVWYANAVAPFSEGQILAFNVQSLRALLGRVEYGPAALLDWDVHELSPWTRYLSTALSLLLAAVIARCFLRKPSVPGSAEESQCAQAMEFGVILLFACVTSPLSWSHYYAWFLIPAAWILKDRPRGVRAFPFWTAVVLSGLPVMIASPALMETVLYSKLLVSHYLIGSLLLIWLLLRTLPYRMGHGATRST